MSQGHQPAYRAAFTTLGNSMITITEHRRTLKALRDLSEAGVSLPDSESA